MLIHLFYDISYGEIVFGPGASRDTVITQFDHNVKLTSKCGDCPGGLGMSCSTSCLHHPANGSC